ncbi:tetratricopeptide repeat-containing diguanylate cyclase [Jidongwangia harbinensis]|uniref:tetratricopeptide repeat-containing diguanylate cyclase n=1 Tax=Jidongwangia harbinensis TaxID=2878561 RepID=UPI001CD9BC8C|nr:GGDEF domain-containing protein [Jidongwangia harbinensis]MCA2215759.1 GGDEF domain-containing protein [Jidongwangia harbinensis]
MNQHASRAAQLSADLLEIEDAYLWDATAALRTSVELERRAAELGDDLLLHRARLCQVNMLMRNGDLAGAARRIWQIHHWAVDHDATPLRARTHLVWANIHRFLGDAAQCLEHSVLAVELLDEQATAHMQIWHRAKLADSLGLSGSMADARLRYAQAEELSREFAQPHLLVGMLNNYAYTEYLYGDYERAQQVAGKLRAVAAEYGFELDPAALDTIGAIEIENGRYAEAEQTLLNGIERHRDGRHEDADALAEYLLTLARAQRGLGATDRAQASLDASRALCVERELNDVLVRVHQEQAELHAVRGEFAEAYAAHKVFFSAYHSLHSAQREAQARTRQAMFETAEARQEAERFREQARRDPLTGLRNRRYVDEQLPSLVDSDPGLTLALVDLDHFKQINDQLSHDVGDQVLIQVAKLLETELAAVAPDGFAARLGGEEFLLALPGTGTPSAVAALEEIRRAVASYPWDVLADGLTVTVSIGVASRREAAGLTQAELLSAADRNLYTAKRAGRDRVVTGTARAGRIRPYRDSASAA